MISSGNTLARIFTKASEKLSPAIGWMSGTISGTSTATARLISTV